MRCPYCGFELGSETAARKLYVKGSRSTFLRLIIALSLASGVINLVVGANESTFQYANYAYQGPIPELAHYLALAQVPIGSIVALLGAVQLLIFYGLVYGKAFPRRYLLRTVGLTFVLAAAMVLIDEVINNMFSLPGSILGLDIFFVLWSSFVLVLVWRYVMIQETRAILRSTGAS